MILLSTILTYSELDIKKLFPESFMKEPLIFTKSIFKKVPKYTKIYTLKDYLMATSDERLILFDKYLSKKNNKYYYEIIYHLNNIPTKSSTQIIEHCLVPFY